LFVRIIYFWFFCPPVRASELYGDQKNVTGFATLVFLIATALSAYALLFDMPKNKSDQVEAKPHLTFSLRIGDLSASPIFLTNDFFSSAARRI
jgi:hypothetical protein